MASDLKQAAAICGISEDELTLALDKIKQTYKDNLKLEALTQEKQRRIAEKLPGALSTLSEFAGLVGTLPGYGLGLDPNDPGESEARDEIESLLLDLQLRVFPQLQSLAINFHSVPVKSLKGIADNALLNQVARLLSFHNKVTCSKDAYSDNYSYKGTLADFLNCTLPYFGIDAGKSNAFCQLYDKKGFNRFYKK